MKEFITDYLNSYRQTDNADYAVLISGAWGSGKTYFVKQFLSSEAAVKHHIYISLNGISNKKEIDILILQQLYPLLNNKYIKGIGNAVSLVARGVAGFFSGGTVNLKEDLKTISEISKLLRAHTFLLVLDDIERCLMRPAELFGYVSELLADQIKVILIGAEDQFIKLHSDNGIPYEKIKEKVVGKTFEIPPDIDSIYKSLVDDSGCAKAHDSLIRKREQVIGDFKSVDNHYNYRALKNCFRELDFWLGYMPEWALRSSSFVDDFTCMYVALSYEVQLGLLKWEDYGQTSSSLTGDEPETVFDNILKRHGVSHDRWFDPAIYLILPTDIMGRMLFSKSISKHELEIALKTLPYFVKNKDQSTWERLWSFYSLEDPEVKALCTKLRSELKALHYRRPEELLHIFTILADLSENKLIDISLDSIYEKAEHYANRLLRRGILEDAIKDDNYFEPLNHGYGNYSYRGEFGNKVWHAKIRSILLAKLQERAETEAKNWVQGISGELHDPQSAFYKRIFSDPSLRDIPIFSFLKPRSFLQAFVKMPNLSKREIGERLNRRIHTITTNASQREKDFWIAVKHFGDKHLARQSSKKNTIALIQLKILSRTISNWYRE